MSEAKLTDIHFLVVLVFLKHPLTPYHTSQNNQRGRPSLDKSQ